jgi:hypothetical protein
LAIYDYAGWIFTDVDLSHTETSQKRLQTAKNPILVCGFVLRGGHYGHAELFGFFFLERFTLAVLFAGSGDKFGI